MCAEGWAATRMCLGIVETAPECELSVEYAVSTLLLISSFLP